MKYQVSFTGAAMKTLVVCASKTGNTRKPAEHCAALQQEEVSSKVLEASKQKRPQPVWIQDHQDAVYHPDDHDLQNQGSIFQAAFKSVGN
ncbi:MAG: hypothetical protein V2I36_14215 [Desulfopila sp.]|nr:hypothetical protein [Desulfopila sp.]